MSDEKKCKIVIFGAFGAGKTTLIKTLDPESRHVEAADCTKGSTTVALDYGRLQVDGICAHLYGTPGQERFEFAREIISKGMDGAILLVDATRSRDEFTQHLYDSLSAAKVPMVVFLNRCGDAGAIPDQLKTEFGTSPVRMVSALDREESVRAVSDFVGTLPLHEINHR